MNKQTHPLAQHMANALRNLAKEGDPEFRPEDVAELIADLEAITDANAPDAAAAMREAFDILAIF